LTALDHPKWAAACSVVSVGRFAHRVLSVESTRLWEAPCTNVGRCHHEAALEVVLESMRDCAFGDWDPTTGERRTVLLTDPIETSLANTSDKAIYSSRAPARLAKADLLGSTIVVGLSSGFDRLAALVVLGTIRRV